MSKRNTRRYAAVAGVALALGSMAPAVAAIDLGGGASADVNVDAIALLEDVTGSLPIPSLPSADDVTDIVGGVNGLLLADVGALLGAVTGNLTTLTGAVTAPVTANVATVSGVFANVAADLTDAVNVGDITANVLSGNQLDNILSGEILSNLPAFPGVGLPGLDVIDSLLGLNLLEVDLNASGTVNVLSALMGSL